MRVTHEIRRFTLASLTAAACALVPLAAHADVAACRALIGFDTTLGGVVTGGGVWATVAASRASFVSNNSVANCAVPVVTSSGKAKPDKTIYLGGPMTQDECSMYGYLSSIDSKLATGKMNAAALTSSALVAKIDDLGAVGKLVNPGYTDVRAGASGLSECIVLLP